MTINSNVTINIVSILVSINLSLINKKAIPKYSLVLDHYRYNSTRLLLHLEVMIALTASVISPTSLLGYQTHLYQYMFKS